MITPLLCSLPPHSFSPSAFCLLPSAFLSASPAATVAHGRDLAARARPGEVWGLVGDLGAGKTHFVQGLVQGAGVPVDAEVTSPTFTLVHEYVGGRLPVFHFDFYRLRTAAETLALGLDEYLDGGGLAVIEWADRFPELLPTTTRWFRFEILEGNGRRIVESAKPPDV